MIYRDLQAILARVRNEFDVNWFPINRQLNDLLAELGRLTTIKSEIRESVLDAARFEYHQLYDWLVGNHPCYLSGCYFYTDASPFSEPFKWFPSVGITGSWMHRTLVEYDLRVLWSDFLNTRVYNILFLGGQSLPSDFLEHWDGHWEYRITDIYSREQAQRAYESLVDLLQNYMWHYVPIKEKIEGHEELDRWYFEGLLKVDFLGCIWYKEFPEHPEYFKELELPRDWDEYSPQELYDFIAANTWLWKAPHDKIDFEKSSGTLGDGNLVWKRQPGEYDAVLGGSGNNNSEPRDGDAVLGGIDLVRE